MSEPKLTALSDHTGRACANADEARRAAMRALAASTRASRSSSHLARRNFIIGGRK